MDINYTHSNKQENGDMGPDVVVSDVPTPMLKLVGVFGIEIKVFLFA